MDRQVTCSRTCSAARAAPAYVAVRWSQLEALGGPVVVPEAGVNWMIAGQHAKVTLHYRSRPVFEAQTYGKPVEKDRKSEVTLQLQLMY